MANYPFNYNPYMQDLQSMRERIDRTMQQYQQNQSQMQQQPQIHQNFQLAPVQQNELEARYVNSIDEVKNIFVMREGLFVNRDMTTLWVKNISGDIKTYNLNEVIEIDPKDAEINSLKSEIANMRELLSQQVEKNKLSNISEEVKPTKVEKKK